MVPTSRQASGPAPSPRYTFPVMIHRIAGRCAAVLTSLLVTLGVALLGLATPAATAQSVAIDLLSFGAGDHMRAGDWTAIKVRLTANSTEAITAQIVWEVPNADGDPTEYVRTVTLAPGQALDKWLYALLPPSASPLDLAGTAWSVRAFLLEDGARVREIGATRISGAAAQTPTRPVELEDDLMLVLGDRRLGLEQYSDSPQGGVAPLGLQCRTILASGATLNDLPDRWIGLAPYSTIIWCDAERRPAQLKTEQANALREWVWRGGTLIVSIANAPDSWGIGRPGTHPLEDLLPGSSPTRMELRIADVLPVLSKYPDARVPDRSTPVYAWDPSKLDRGYRPLVALPSRKHKDTGLLVRQAPHDGAVVGVQRNYGFGQVVLLGLDVDQLYTQGVHDSGAPVPQADIFWHRVLGRRGDTPTVAEFQEYDNVARTGTPMLTNALNFSSKLGEGQLMSQVIGMPGQAAIGVLAAVALFVLYWALSGPIGFLSLKQFKRERNSWVLFVAVAFLFTAVAWAGGSLITKTRPNLRHVTVIDQLGNDPADTDKSKGIPEQRATSWLSIYLPSYGLTPISIGDGEESGQANVLGSWSPPPTGTGDTFPNKVRYAVDVDSLSDYAVPARKTSADFVARWRGVIDPKWGSPVSQITPVALNVDRTQSQLPWQISGALKHGLPGTLTDVKVLLISPQRTPQAEMIFPANKPAVPAAHTAGQIPLEGRMVSPPRGQWAPESLLDLTALFGEAASPIPKGSQVGSIPRELRERYYKPILPSYTQWMTTSIDPNRQRQYMEMLSFYWMLEPPKWKRDPSDTDDPARAGRVVGRELDLSPWFTRPCLIITGFLDPDTSAGTCPVPVTVDGDSVGGTGVTMFRYILPLDDSALFDFAVPRAKDDPGADEDAVEGSDSAASSDGTAPVD